MSVITVGISDLAVSKAPDRNNFVQHTLYEVIRLVIAELMVEFCVGILMKVVPEIQVMQVNIQVKLLFGLFVLFLLITPISDFIDRYMGIVITSYSIHYTKLYDTKSG